MGLLKKLDIFRSVNREQKEGTILGAVLTFVSIALMCLFFSKELAEFQQKKLNTKLYVLSLSNALINVEFDIIIFNIKCEHIVVGEEHGYEEINLQKIDHEETGCNLIGQYYMQPMDNKLIIRPDMQSTFMDLMMNSGMGGDTQRIDFSHKINKFQFGRSVSGLTDLSETYPDLVLVNPLNGHEFHSSTEQDGHSVFLYELNIVGAKINGKQEIIYHHNSNTINSLNIQPAITFIHDFSAIGVSYDERRSKHFLEFLTYLFAIVGGILAIIRFLNNLLLVCIIGKRVDATSIMELS